MFNMAHHLLNTRIIKKFGMISDFNMRITTSCISMIKLLEILNNNLAEAEV